MPGFCANNKSAPTCLVNKKRKGLMASSAMALYSSPNLPAVCASLLMGLLTLGQVSGFPDGAPGEACTRHKPNHGGTAQPLALMPFSVTASNSTYKPGETVAVRIQSKYGKYFKGFFVQASDERGRWIGHFEPTDFSVSHPECAATTHHENREKEEVTLVWHPPNDGTGTVRFLASILKTYKLYWVDAPAITPSKSDKVKKVEEVEEAEKEAEDDKAKE